MVSLCAWAVHLGNSSRYLGIARVSNSCAARSNVNREQVHFRR